MSLAAVALALCMLAPVAWAHEGGEADVNFISPELLRDSLQDGTLTVLDVRLNKDWYSSGLKVPGAIREDPARVEDWARKYDKGQALVVY